MKLVIDGYFLFLGRPRKDGSRKVERVRLTQWRDVLPGLILHRYVLQVLTDLEFIT